MKFLLILGLALLVVWIWKNKRRADVSAKRGKPAQQSAQLMTTEIVACDICQVHLPRSEALTGPAGTYCSDAHRQQASGQ